jgi:hypothetical protein
MLDWTVLIMYARGLVLTQCCMHTYMHANDSDYAIMATGVGIYCGTQHIKQSLHAAAYRVLLVMLHTAPSVVCVVVGSTFACWVFSWWLQSLATTAAEL